MSEMSRWPISMSRWVFLSRIQKNKMKLPYQRVEDFLLAARNRH